jgi:heptosyltransferase-3
VIKKHFPDCKVTFLCSPYTRPVVEMCRFVDAIAEYPHPSFPSPFKKGEGKEGWAILHVFPDKAICKAAKKAGIPVRIATSHRWFTWLTCNRLVSFSRKNSDLHEAQLNLKLLEPLGISKELSREEIPDYYGITPPLSPFSHGGGVGEGVQPTLSTIILHPRSKGSAREWGLENYSRLIDLLSPDKYRILVTGTKEEGDSMGDFLEKHKSRITDLTGKLTLPELISVISNCDALVAASTGPLHIAAALGKRAIGLYAPMRPIHPGRWAPLGTNAHYMVLEKDCNKCRKTGDCECIRSIRPEEVAGLIEGRGT